MKEKVIKIIRTTTFYDTSLVTGATFINGFLGFVFYALLARFLEAGAFGVFIVATTALSMIADIANVGTDTGIVNFVGRYLISDRDRALRFLKLALEVKVLVSVLVLAIGWFLVPTIAMELFGKTELIFPLRIALIGVCGTLLFMFTASSLQAIQKFVAWSLLNIFSNLGRLIILYGLLLLGVLTIDASLIIYIIIPFIAFFAAFSYLPNFLKVKNERSVASEFFNYNKWVAVFILISAVASRLDIFLVTRFLSLEEVGIYSFAVTITSVIPQIVAAIGTVIAPKLAGFETKEKAVTYLKKAQVLVGGLAIGGILFGIPGGYVLMAVVGKGYVASFSPYIILLLAQALFLFSVPIHMAVIYYFSRPSFFVLVGFVNILIVAILGLILIPAYGYIGAAITILAGNMANFIIPGFWVVREFRRK